MFAHAINHQLRKERAQNLCACLFVETVLGVVHLKGAELGRKMPDIMQKGGHDDVLAVARAFGQSGPLQHVLRHRDRLTQIFLSASSLEDICQKRDDCVGGQVGNNRGRHDAASCKTASSE